MAGDNPQMMMPGQTGEQDLLTAGASATLPDAQANQQRAAALIQQLIQSRMGGGSGITFGAQPPAQPHIPQPPAQPGRVGIPQGPFASTGERKRADKQAMFSSIANIVQSAEKKHYDMKVQKITQDFDTLKNAMAGYQEAQSSGNQEAAKHNANLINSIVMDPKKSKELAKAFDVDVNPLAKQKKQQPNPANDALKASFSKDTQDFANKKTDLTPQAQAFMRAMPQRAGIDPKVELMAQLTKMGMLPKAAEELTFQKDLMQIQQRIQNNELTNETREKIATMFANAKDKETQAKIQGIIYTVQNKMEQAKMMERMWDLRGQRQLEGVHERNQVLKDRLDLTKGNADDKKMATAVTGLKNQAESLDKELATAQKAHDIGKIKEINQKIDSLHVMQQLIQGEIAKRIGLDPSDFNQDQITMDPDMWKSMETLFAGPQEEPNPDQ